MLPALALSVALSATAAPPGQVVNHGQPAHYTQPTVREYERFQTDYCRRIRYNDYVAALDKEWQLYRDSGSSPEAFATYKAAARDLKKKYVWTDPYLVPVTPGTGTPGMYSSMDPTGGEVCFGTPNGNCGRPQTEPSCEANK